MNEKGGEQMLSLGEIQDNCYMERCFSKGKAIFDAGNYKDVQVYQDELSGEDVIEGRVKENGSDWYCAEVTIDSDLDYIVDYECECQEHQYQEHYGMCEHCVTLALVYRALQQSAAGQKKQSGKNTLPMQTQTSAALKEVIRSYAVQDRAHLFGGFYRQVKLEPEITGTYDGYQIGFKIGAARMYVLKNIPKLIFDVEKGNEVSYGKNFCFVHDRTAFTEEALQWIDLMGKIIKGTSGNTNLEYYSYGGEYRRLSLRAYGIEQVLNMRMGKDIVLDGKRMEVSEEEPRPVLHFTAQANKGAFLSMERMAYIEGYQHQFAVTKNKIFRCSKEFTRNVEPLAAVLGAIGSGQRYRPNQELYLNQTDYQAFCGNVLPKITPFVDLDYKGMSLEEYMPKEAEFSVYLSQGEEDGSILAKCEVNYGAEKYDILEEMNLAGEYRDGAAEAQMRELMNRYFELEQAGEQKPGAMTPMSVQRPHVSQFCCRDEDQIYRLVREGMAELSEHAQLFVDEKIKGIRVVGNPRMNIGVSLGGDLLELDVQIGDMSPDEMFDILSAYRRRKKYYRMKSGDFIKIEDNGVATLAELAQGLSLSREELEKGRLSVPRYRIGYVDAVLKNRSEDLEVKRDTAFKQLVRNMREYPDSDYEVPEGLTAKLRNYQKEGFRWLCTLAGWGFGGILADDMGLGKTVQMLAFLLKEQKRALIVSPASLVYNWAGEAERFAPGLSVATIAGNSEVRKEELRKSREADVVITSYDLLKRDIEEYGEETFDYMIIDEAQYIKNAGTQAARAVKSVRAGVRFALTGTPIENRLGDLWSIFDYVLPGYLYEYPQFKEEIELPIVQSEDKVAMERLHMMISPFILRRKKQDVLKDLPDKLEEVMYTQMNPEQRKLYDANVSRLKMELAGQTEEEFKKESIKYLAELTKLRQICCAPELLYENYSAGSGKADACMELVKNALEGEHKILLFSQFTRMLDRIGAMLEQEGISYLYLSGKSSKTKRQEMVEQFQNGAVPVFLISLKAGGTGLNLTAADVVIHYDPWWNVAAQNQATDRTHRIGQKNVVTVIKLVAKDTIEEKIIKLQERKAKLSEDVIEGKDMSEYRLNREELMGLLEDR